MRRKNRECEDIIYFGEKYFSHFLTEKTSEFHRDMFTMIEKNTTDRIDILAPRGHAKSTWLSIIYPIWKICYNREINILIISDTQEQADKFLRAIKDELEMNEKLIETYGEFYQETQKGETSVWRATSIIVKREKRSKEDTITCGGTGKRIIGKRADLILVDDPLNDENTANEKQREKTKGDFIKH